MEMATAMIMEMNASMNMTISISMDMDMAIDTDMDTGMDMDMDMALDMSMNIFMPLSMSMNMNMNMAMATGMDQSRIDPKSIRTTSLNIFKSDAMGDRRAPSILGPRVLLEPPKRLSGGDGCAGGCGVYGGWWLWWKHM